jgi:hypothetical protein
MRVGRPKTGQVSMTVTSLWGGIVIENGGSWLKFVTAINFPDA